VRTVTINTQQVSSVIRQVCAVAAIVVGILSAPGVISFLPTWVAAALVTAGSVLVAIEHYVSDPSTGTTATQSTTAAVKSGATLQTTTTTTPVV